MAAILRDRRTAGYVPRALGAFDLAVSTSDQSSTVDDCERLGRYPADA